MSATSAAGARASTATLSSKQSHGSAVLRAASVAPRGAVRARGALCVVVACAVVARTLSLLWRVPLVDVNHCVAHIEMGRLITKARDPAVLYVSGGNTQVIAYNNGRYQIFGETIDIAIGNALDRVARALHLPNDPAPGLHVENCARSGKRLLDLPYAVKGMDVSFSGLLTKAESLSTRAKRTYDRNAPLPPPEACLASDASASDDDEYTDADVCLTLQETCFAMLVETAERAMSHTGADSLLLVGGVGCNKRLQAMAEAMCAARGAICHATDGGFCIGDGAMVAWAGWNQYNAWRVGASDTSDEAAMKAFPVSNGFCTQRFRTDDVYAGAWRNLEEEGDEPTAKKAKS